MVYFEVFLGVLKATVGSVGMFLMRSFFSAVIQKGVVYIVVADDTWLTAYKYYTKSVSLQGISWFYAYTAVRVAIVSVVVARELV